MTTPAARESVLHELKKLGPALGLYVGCRISWST